MVERLEHRIAGLGSAIVAFSGGVDSSLVAALAARALGDDALAITAISPALAHGELDGARRVADAIGIAHETITTDELASEDYRRNDRYRCFHCKTELYGRLTEIANERGYRAVLSGANADDAGDWRPGLQAAEDHGVLHPLLELGVTKRQVRELAAALNVPSADKPASPCLASRIPYGTPVERTTLQRVDAAEQAVKALGYRELRVRHHGDLGRLEIGADELARATRERKAIERAIRAAGYDRAEIDPKPFRSGSLNLLPMAPTPGATAP
jgi:pyridinium-3,5-biscarboxylic acid mononucleotide sulfurtransferase